MATILIYGATGHTGRLIAERAALLRDHRYVIAARRAGAVRDLAAQLQLDWRAFALDEVDDVRSGLHGVQLVINAAGPFSATAQRLAKSAIKLGVHYVDICGEVDAYLELRRLRGLAERQEVALVCGAAQTPGVSNLLLEYALVQAAEADEQRGVDAKPWREIRIGMTRPRTISGGSLQTFFEMVQDRVVIARPSGTLRTVPAGRLQHLFNFGSQPRVATAANLLDTVAAGDSLQAKSRSAESVVSYLEASAWMRLGADLGALAEPLRALPAMQAWSQVLSPMLSTASATGPDGVDGHTVVVQIEDMARQRVEHRVRTADVYGSTAVLALRAAASVLDRGLRGWVQPGQALHDKSQSLEQWLDQAGWQLLG